MCIMNSETVRKLKNCCLLAKYFKQMQKFYCFHFHNIEKLETIHEYIHVNVRC